MRKFLLLSAVALTVAVVWMSMPVQARLLDSQFMEEFVNPTGEISSDGISAFVSGTVACTADERFLLEVDMIQPSTGAFAEGATLGTCTGEAQSWEVEAHDQSVASFEEGLAEVCATARTYTVSGPTDLYQDCAEEVELLPPLQ